MGPRRTVGMAQSTLWEPRKRGHATGAPGDDLAASASFAVKRDVAEMLASIPRGNLRVLANEDVTLGRRRLRRPGTLGAEHNACCCLSQQHLHRDGKTVLARFSAFISVGPTCRTLRSMDQ